MRRRSDRGNGVFSSVFGVGVFLVLLFFASHVLLNLWLTSSIDSVAHDAATDAATSGADGAHLAAVEERSIRRAREILGRYGDRVEMQFENDPAGQSIVLHVRAPALDLLPAFVADATGLGGVDHRISVHRERADR